MLTVALVLCWFIAFLWASRAYIALRNLPRVPNLLDDTYCELPSDPQQSSITVIVPACNEEQAIEATLRSLLANEGVQLEILAVNDRSTDTTGAIMDRVASEGKAQGKNIRVLHIQKLSAGWMGKTHAMALAAEEATSPWLLFTDGDVLFRKDALRRALAYATLKQADHLVLFPTLILKTFGERMMIGLIQTLTLLVGRPWNVANPEAKRDTIGVGQFNMVRRDVYYAIGGFEPLRMEVLEDLRLGFEIKHQGHCQHVVFGRDLIRLHWAHGALGIMGNLTKNAFAASRYRSIRLLGTCVGLGVLYLGPLLGLFGPLPLRIASLASLAVLSVSYWLPGRYFNRISTSYVLTLPIAVCLLLYAMLRSMLLALARSGVIWRGTFYPLAELRKHAGPLP